MKESIIYQAIVAEGVAKGLAKGELIGARKLLFKLGEAHFGTPAPEAVRVYLESLNDLKPLEELASRIHLVRTWEALLPKVRKPKRPRSFGIQS